MARPTPKAKPLYRNRQTRYIYSIAYRTPVRFKSNATPSPGEVELITLAFHGQHPDYENTIVTTSEDFYENFEAYDPIKTDAPVKADSKFVVG